MSEECSNAERPDDVTALVRTMHQQPAFINDTDVNQFREMCWGCGTARSVLVIEKEDETIIVGGLWCWQCSRAVHQDCLSKDSASIVTGCRAQECPLFPPI